MSLAHPLLCFVLLCLASCLEFKFAAGVRQVKRREQVVAAAPDEVASVEDEVVAGRGRPQSKALWNFESEMKSLVFNSQGAASLESMGSTSQEHELWVVRFKPEKHSGKKVLFTFNLVPSGNVSHAGLGLIEQLIKKTRSIPKWLEQTELVVVPMANPDGTRRSLRVGRERRSCSGVNLDHNFEKGWQQGSAGPCSEEYPGPSAMSEPETQALAAEIQAGVSVHVNVGSGTNHEVSVGYSCARCGQLPKFREHFDLAGRMTKAMSAVYQRRHRTSYARAGSKSGTIKDYSLSKGILAAEMSTTSEEESLAGLFAAIAFAQNM